MYILYLVDKKTYLTKMSRVRFHGMEALKNITNVHFSGNGWNDYDSKKTVQENIDNMNKRFDIVIAYKPLELKQFKNVNIPKCIRYNEMYDVKWTLKEIKNSGAQLVICHHLNDCEKYKKMNIPGVSFVYVGHCAKKSIFKNYQLEKKYDILIAGFISPHYPLRNRFIKLLPKLSKKFICHKHPHPGYNRSDSYTDKYLIQMAKAINQSKITLTDTGIPRSRYGKYIEIPMCGTSAICGDLPDDNADDYSFVIHVHNNMTDDEIIEKINNFLNNENERLAKIEKGIAFAENYTQSHYAQRLLEKISFFLKHNLFIQLNNTSLSF